jgi:DNA polymerase III subunit delta
MNKNYLISGEETYLIEQKVNDIIKENNEASVLKWDLTDYQIVNVLNDASMPALLSEKKIVIGYDAFFLSSDKKADTNHNVDELLKYLNNPNPDTILILVVLGKLDERKKIVKELKNIVKSFEFNKLKENELYNITLDMFIKNNYKISKDVVEFLLQRTGNNIRRISEEANKLMLYRLDEKEISKDDVYSLVTKIIEDNIFDLVDAVVSKDKSKIFEIYRELINQKEEPIKIIVILANQFRLIYQVKVLINHGYTEKDIAAKLDIHPFRVKLAYQKGNKYKEEILLKYLNELADLDINIKTGIIDKNIGLELFFLHL